jgi:hypothetical protein
MGRFFSRMLERRGFGELLARPAGADRLATWERSSVPDIVFGVRPGPIGPASQTATSARCFIEASIARCLVACAGERG